MDTLREEVQVMRTSAGYTPSALAEGKKTATALKYKNSLSSTIDAEDDSPGGLSSAEPGEVLVVNSVHGQGYWDRSLDDLIYEFGGKVPPLLHELRRVILEECTETEGIFRRTSNVSTP